MPYFVYILECADGSLYTGVTNHVDRRFQEHCDGRDPRAYTYTRRPVILAYVEEHAWVTDAIEREKQIKRWSKAKKSALIKGQLAELSALAKRRGDFV